MISPLEGSRYGEEPFGLCPPEASPLVCGLPVLISARLEPNLPTHQVGPHPHNSRAGVEPLVGVLG